MIQLIESIKKQSKGWTIISLITVAIMLLWSAVGVDLHHAHTWAEQHIPLFWSLFTLISAVVLIYVAGFVGTIIQIREDYYDK